MGALLTLTGCDATGESVTPETSADAVPTNQVLRDPCAQVSDDILRQMGLDPAMRNNTISDVEDDEGWKLCSWKDKPVRENYKLGIWATTHAIEDSKQDKNNISFTDITISDLAGVPFKRAEDTHDEVCDLSFRAHGGAIDISIYKAVSTRDDRDPCDMANPLHKFLSRYS
ncbi:DUF3558 domain-containing protein [Nocardia carnea]|uniref:DUF3558 domain-containing protein n=1 Tax=Nocardia carnea TaxID=37328 RepID=UPI0024540D63|nr:DUF3558 domain-containing protein [Nocardia carnea]